MQKTDTTTVLDELFGAGAHFGYSKSRRHPTVAPYIFGVKNRFEIIDLEKTVTLLDKALEYVAALAKEKKTILFVASKQEAVAVTKAAAEKLAMPYVAGRWIGGTLTNFGEIRKRIDMLARLQEEREKGLLAKYTKKERLLIDRKITKLEERFGGLASLTKKPHAVFVVDSRHESIAVDEARCMGVPVIGIAGTDCDLSQVDFPIVANDSLEKSISYIVGKVVEAYEKNVQ